MQDNTTSSRLSLEERIAYLEQRIVILESKVPETQMLSSSFWTRAFAVWSHLFVANSIITIPIFCVGLLLGGF